ncbi:uncharacterized protein LOC134710103 [Mytilus trossulus]|uniref:uncharacterized protein LOC134710103 n=1 Tax=Mytilus trossulus TaxID=6551 RepID=UPI003003B518
MPWTLKCSPFLSKLIEKVSCRIQTFLTLYVSALMFVIAVSTNEWFLCGTKVKTGIWNICLFQPASNHWKCDSFKSDFAVAVQAFSVMCIFGYVLTVVFLIIFIKCPTSSSTMFSLTLSLCLLCLSIACLQMMTMIVYAIKVKDSIIDVIRMNFSQHSSSMSWSFGLALISVVMTTVSAVLAFSEIRKITGGDSNGVTGPV